MSVSFNGWKIVDTRTIGISRATHILCLNCGFSCDNYNQKWCKVCFCRNNFGNVEQFTEILKEKNLLDTINEIEENPDLMEKYNKYHEWMNTRKVSNNSFYAIFWRTYNYLIDKIFNF